jgi:4-amino-4-deoxy-L-arabinose transferase-like glycosyltransferase
MSSKFFVLLFILAVFTRFFGINWDQGYFSHPDENNMATALSQLSSQNLNPHFFAYGQFPLYLGYFSLKLINIPNTFSNSIYVLRFYSAIFSLFFLYFAYLLSIKLFSKSSQKVAGCIFVDIERGNTFTGNKNISKSFCNKTLIFLLFLIFSPGLIQIAHFGTTESLLSFIFIANLYFLIKIYENPKFKYFVITAILSGIGLGSKITAIFFIWPIILMGVYKKQFLSTSFFILAFSLIFLITSPYNIIDINDFLSSMRYETDVATGNIDVFYTRQFVNTTSYIFQFTHIFPYVVGLPVFFFSFFNFFYCANSRDCVCHIFMGLYIS